MFSLVFCPHGGGGGYTMSLLGMPGPIDHLQHPLIWELMWTLLLISWGSVMIRSHAGPERLSTTSSASLICTLALVPLYKAPALFPLYIARAPPHPNMFKLGPNCTPSSPRTCSDLFTMYPVLSASWRLALN